MTKSHYRSSNMLKFTLFITETPISDKAFEERKCHVNDYISIIAVTTLSFSCPLKILATF